MFDCDVIFKDIKMACMLVRVRLRIHSLQNRRFAGEMEKTV